MESPRKQPPNPKKPQNHVVNHPTVREKSTVVGPHFVGLSAQEISIPIVQFRISLPAKALDAALNQIPHIVPVSATSIPKRSILGPPREHHIMVPSNGWSLSSTHGYTRLVGLAHSSSNESVVSGVRIEYRLPDEQEAPVIVEIPSLRLDTRRLRALAVELRSWLAQPLGALATDTLEYSVDLAMEASDRLFVGFGKRAEVNIGAGGVGCLVELDHSALKASIAFATDPTCLQAFAEEIEGILRNW
jgi:hypothetical protein